MESTSDFLTTHEQYACIVCLNEIEHLKKDEMIGFLTRIQESLQRDGTLILKTENEGCITGAFNRYFDFTHQVGFVEPSLRQVLVVAGFSKIKFIEEKVPPPYSLRTRARLAFVWCYRMALRLAYEFERRGNIMPTRWGKDLTAIVWK